MSGAKTNERPGTRAVLRGYHMSASKARVVLDLIRGRDVQTAAEILQGTTREAADVVLKVLVSAVANAVNNDGLNAEDLYVAAAFADEGVTMKRFKPRARGRAGKIRKRACHITVIVARLDDDRLEVVRASRSAQVGASRARRVASSRRGRSDAAASDEMVEETAVLEENVVSESPVEVGADVTELTTADEMVVDETATSSDETDETPEETK
ncbi:MAG: 50S ribosomal protein L22 [Acidimicrobiaceae bacterium]|nr:50S ribosomal protein L22 [Acidimicrobiaceae bacterium]